MDVSSQLNGSAVLSAGKEVSSTSYGYKTRWMAIIQGDTGGKVSILEADCIGYCKKRSYKHVCGSEWVPRQSCLNLQIQKHCV